MPTTHTTQQPPRWLEAPSTDPDHPCYTTHRAWARLLAAGYTTALAAYDAEALEKLQPVPDAEQTTDGTIVVPAAQLSEWVLDDLDDETPQVHG